MTTDQTFQPSKRNHGIDYLRGLLIALVIIGHIVVGSVHDNWLRYPIHAFHMPLFIGLTGYLLNPKTLLGSSWFDLSMRYWWRLLFPFAFAFAFFTGILFVHAVEEQRLSFGLLLSYLHTPYYHLWFIPTMVLWILAYRLILSVNLLLFLSLLLFSVISLYWASVPRADQLAVLVPFLGKKVIYFFSFFLLGAWLRADASAVFRELLWRYRGLGLGVIVICFILYCWHIGFTPSVPRGVAWFILNVLLIALAIPWFKQLGNRLGKHLDKNRLGNSVSNGSISRASDSSVMSSINGIFVALGRNSLPVYLWHVLPLFLLKGFDVHQHHLLLYYFISIVTTALIVWAIFRFEGRHPMLNRVVYGN